MLMSAIGSKADITRAYRNVCFWHKADVEDVSSMSAIGGEADIPN